MSVKQEDESHHKDVTKLMELLQWWCRREWGAARRIAKVVGVSDAVMSKWVNGGVPRTNQFLKLRDALNAEVAKIKEEEQQAKE